MTVNGRRRMVAATVGLVMAAGVSSAQAASSPQVAVDPDGTAHLGWLDGLVTERSWTAAGALGAPQHISPIRATVPDFDMAADDGGASFVWQRQRSKLQVEGRRRLADGSLGPLLALSASATDTVSARVATDPAGNSVFVWRRTGSPSSYIHARRLSAAGVLGPSLTLSAANSVSKEPEVAMDGNGNAFAVWVRHAPAGGEVVQLRRIGADGALGATETVSPSAAAAAAEPQVAFDAAGNALVAWLRYDGDGFFPQIRRRSAAGALSTVQTLSAATGKSAEHLRLAVAPGGSAMAVWSRRGSSLPEVQGRHRSADGTLGTAFRVSGTDSFRFSADVPQVVMDANGNALMVWHWQDWSEGAERASVHLRRRAANGALGPVQDVSTEPTGDAALFPRIAAASDGGAAIAWQAWTPETDFRIHARKRRPDGTFASIVRMDTP